MKKTVHESGASGKASFLPSSRWYGLGALFGGLLFLVWGYVDRPNIEGLSETLVDLLAFLVPALFATGFLGFRFRFQRRRGPLGKTGTILSLFGAVWGAGVGLSHIYSLEIIQNWQPIFVPYGWLGLLTTGSLLSGIAMICAGWLRNQGILTLAIGIFGWVYLLTDSNAVFEMRSIHVVCGILFALCWMALGYMILADTTRFRSTRTKSSG